MGKSIEAAAPITSFFDMSSRELFFDAVDMNVVKADHGGAHLGGPAQAGATREGREGEGGAIDAGLRQEGQQSPPRPPTPPLQRAAEAAQAPAAATAIAPPPPPPPPPQTSNTPITASELRLAASAALRLAVEAIDALHALKEAVFDMAGDVRELLEATRRAGVGAGRGGGGSSGGSGRRGRRPASSARRSDGNLGVRTRAQARRRR